LLSLGQHWKNGRPFFRNEIIAKTVVRNLRNSTKKTKFYDL